MSDWKHIENERPPLDTPVVVLTKWGERRMQFDSQSPGYWFWLDAPHPMANTCYATEAFPFWRAATDEGAPPDALRAAVSDDLPPG